MRTDIRTHWPLVVRTSRGDFKVVPEELTEALVDSRAGIVSEAEVRKLFFWLQKDWPSQGQNLKEFVDSLHCWAADLILVSERRLLACLAFRDTWFGIPYGPVRLSQRTEFEFFLTRNAMSAMALCDEGSLVQSGFLDNYPVLDSVYKYVHAWKLPESFSSNIAEGRYRFISEEEVIHVLTM